MPETTVGTTGAEKTGTETAAVKSETPATGANGAEKKTDLQARFDALTGEIARKNEKIGTLETRVTELSEKLKTDDEKRIEQLAAEKFKPELEANKQMRDFLNQRLEGLMAKIPPENQAMVLKGDHIPVYQQIVQAEGVLALINKGSTAQPFNSGGNPQTETKRMYSQAEYQKWATSASNDLAYYTKHREEMMAAVREGRVEGMR